MEYALLRSLRALGPGLILLGFFDLFLILVMGKDAYFWELDSAKLFLVGYAVGGVYGVLASLANRDRFAFDGVNESTLAALQKYFPEAIGRAWHEVSPCFYKLIDTDKSLEQKSKGIFFNGLILTTSFDAIWISFGASLVGGGVALFKGEWLYLVLAATAEAVSYLIWRASIRRHCDLAKGQVSVIERRLSNEFRSCLRGEVCLNRDGR